MKQARFNLNIRPDRLDEIRRTAEKDGVTATEVINMLLKIGLFIHSQDEQGNTILIDNPEEGTRKEVKLL